MAKLTASILTVRDVAERLKVARRTVIDMIGRGEIPATKIGRQWVIDIDLLRDAIRRRSRRR